MREDEASATNTANRRGTMIRAVALWELHVKGDQKRKRIKPGASETTAPHVWVDVTLGARFGTGPGIILNDITDMQ
jgi:hypothetical protein